MYRAVPAWLLKWSNRLTATYYFGTETSAEAALLRQIIDDTDPGFLRWAIREIMAWSCPVPLPGVAHVHGGRDRIFPAAPIRNTTIIAGAGHFMAVNRAAAVSAFIAQELARA